MPSSPPSAFLFDLTRMVSRVGERPTGIDRIDRAYLGHLLTLPTPLFGLVRTSLGFLLLGKQQAQWLLDNAETRSLPDPDPLSSLSRRKNRRLAAIESQLRSVCLDRCLKSRLGKMLGKHVPKGGIYFNIGHANLSNRVLWAARHTISARVVVFVHDTIPLDYPDFQTVKSVKKFRRFFQNAVRSSDLLICNSQATKTAIQQHAKTLGAHPHIKAIHPGVLKSPIATKPHGFDLHPPYFVAVGTLEPRKNLGFLLDLWAAEFQSSDLRLLLCGHRGWLNKDVFARLDASPRNVQELSDLSDTELTYVISKSNGLLFPSHAEGFGFPAIEAAALGIPVICNTLPVFRETLGDYPIYADVSDVYSWSRKIKQLAQRRRDIGGEQKAPEQQATVPDWTVHFDKLFAYL